MSSFETAMQYILGLLSPGATFTGSPSTNNGISTAPTTAPETSEGSYFPSATDNNFSNHHNDKTGMSPRSSFSRSSSSASSSTSELVNPDGTTITKGHNPLPPLSRDFPQPTEELDIEKQLAMAPAARSLHGSIRRAATNARVPRGDDADARAKKLAAAKAELLALAGR